MRTYIGVLAVIIVYFLLSSNELYVPRILDSDWLSTRNDPERKGSPFNKCSPESFDECAKVKFPYLSRY
jgi:hypothetical protein